MDHQTYLQQWWPEPLKTASSNPLLCFLILVSLLVVFNKRRRSSKLNPPPSPPKLPIIGNFHQLSKLPHKSLKTLADKYGPLMLLHMGQTPALVVSSMEMIEEITRNHDAVFSDRPSSTIIDILFRGCLDMALGSQSDHWREAKKQCVLQLLGKRKVQEFHFIREEEVAKIIEKIRLSSINGAASTINEMFVTLAHNILSRSAFGCIYESQDNKYTSFGELARKVTDHLSAVCFKDLFPILGWIDHLTGLIGNLEMTAKELNDFFDRLIKERQALMKDDEKAEDRKYLVDMLLYLQKEGLVPDLSRDNLKSILMDMFIAGTDSIAVTSEWIMAELIKIPRIMKKAQEEIRRVVGNKSKITQADIDQMEYLKCVIKESIRFHGSAVMGRQTTKSVKLHGYDIPEKARVLVNVWAIQRDPKLWDRPDEFLPERFLNSSNDPANGEHKQLLFSFGFGRRSCPGMSFAYAELEYIMANLLYWFDWELPNGAKGEDLDMSETWIFVIIKKIPLQVVARPYSP